MLQSLLTYGEAFSGPRKAFVHVLCSLWRLSNTSLLLLASKFISLAKNGNACTAVLVALKL